MRALQHSQQLLLSQTQAVSRAELELRTEAEQHQVSWELSGFWNRQIFFYAHADANLMDFGVDVTIASSSFSTISFVNGVHLIKH